MTSTATQNVINAVKARMAAVHPGQVVTIPHLRSWIRGEYGTTVYYTTSPDANGYEDDGAIWPVTPGDYGYSDATPIVGDEGNTRIFSES